MSASNSLIEALFAIYSRAGAEVTYISDRGEQRPYWANRYRQALQRSVEANEVIEFVERLVTQDEPSRGFFYLKDASRLDLSVEALVVEQFPNEFRPEVVHVARDRLRNHGYEPGQPQEPRTPDTDQSLGEFLKTRGGESFDIRVSVGANGTLSMQIA